MENMIRLINELRKLDDETPWVEFKHNNYNPAMIGSDISALANGAALHEKSQAYMLWGVHDKSHRGREGKIRSSGSRERQLHKLPGRQIKNRERRQFSGNEYVISDIYHCAHSERDRF